MSDLKNDIERYHKGELTPSEMHALEKKALSDPFLADALEGASEVNAKAFEHDVHDLQMLIDKRTDQSKKVIPLWNWSLRIAAGLALIVISTFVILNIVKDDTHKQLAENKVESKSPPTSSEQKEQTPLLDSIEEPKPALALSKSKPKASQPISTTDAQSKKPSAPAEQSSVDTPEALTDLEGSDAEGDKEKNTKREEEIQIAASEQAQVITPAASVKIAEAKEHVAKDSKRKAADVSSGYRYTNTADKLSTTNVRTIKGHVSSMEDGSALPGVNVVIKGTNIGTMTDEEGNYEITLNEKQDEIAFSFIGLQSTELNVGSQNQLDVQMSEDVSQLSEVVVTGYSTRNSVEIENEEATLELAAPLGGRKAYKQYLEKNLRYPEVALENKIEGKVTIEFTVETTGTLSEFKVLRGLGYGCDEEVVRLVKEGARWTPSKYGKELVESNVKIRLRFSLPKK